MCDHYNGLTPAQAERLAMLAEECAEVIQIVGKILRHGYDSFDPANPEVSNRPILTGELTDVAAVTTAMLDANEVTFRTSSDIVAAWQRKLRYAHHQGDVG